MVNPGIGVNFNKSVEDDMHGYSSSGCNMALLIGQGNWMDELESMGSIVTLKPGMVQKLVETWSLA